MRGDLPALPSSPAPCAERVLAILAAQSHLGLAQIRALLWPDLTDQEVCAPRGAGLRRGPSLERQLVARVRRLLILGQLVVSDNRSGGPAGLAFCLQPGAKPEALRLTDLPWESDGPCRALLLRRNSDRSDAAVLQALMTYGPQTLATLCGILCWQGASLVEWLCLARWLGPRLRCLQSSHHVNQCGDRYQVAPVSAWLRTEHLPGYPWPFPDRLMRSCGTAVAG